MGEKPFLQGKYPDFPRSPEVKSAVARQEVRTDERVKGDSASQIEAYLNRLQEIFDTSDPAQREKRIGILKEKLHELFVIKPEEVPEAYFDLQKRIARERGHGDVHLIGEMKQEMIDTVITDQTKSLDSWIDYLGSSDASYPDWFKYFAFRSITKLGEYDKENKKFKNRSQGTTSIFPDINREALAYVADELIKKQKKQPSGQTDEEWQKLLQSENFAKMYAYAIEKITPASQEQKEVIDGQWVKYDQGSGGHLKLAHSLDGHGTGWCTAGESTAEAQLKAGDFYVYYTKDNNGQYSIPRIAIRMENNQIAEVRGINADQNLEGNMTTIAEEKMASLPGAKKYKKRSADMGRMTELENKVKQKQELTKEDLKFLYEVDDEIEGFGYQKDPRIKELCQQRDTVEDMSIIFECGKEQIAVEPRQINKNTKCYVGELKPEIFDLIQQYNVDFLFIPSSTERKLIRLEKIEIGGKTAESLEKELYDKGIKISNNAQSILRSKDFTTLRDPEEITLVILQGENLGVGWEAVSREVIYRRAQKLGLDLCPAETGLHYRLKYTNQPEGEHLNVAMKAITNQENKPDFFSLCRWDGKLSLFDGTRVGGDNAHIKGAAGWTFLFCLRKLKT